MPAECPECGHDEFEDLDHEYYAQQWTFSCGRADCHGTLVVHEQVANLSNPNN